MKQIIFGKTNIGLWKMMKSFGFESIYCFVKKKTSMKFCAGEMKMSQEHACTFANLD